MVQEFIPVSHTQNVVARLYDEGWVDCPDVGFMALSQVPFSNLRQFILTQLQQSTQGWMWQQDLELATLVFSIPDHEFRIHPQLRSVLKQLEVEGVVEVHGVRKEMAKFARMAIVTLKARQPELDWPG